MHSMRADMCLNEKSILAKKTDSQMCLIYIRDIKTYRLIERDKSFF